MKTYKVYWDDDSTTYTELSQYHYDNMVHLSAVTKIVKTKSYKITYADKSYSFDTLDKLDVDELRKSKKVKSITLTK